MLIKFRRYPTGDASLTSLTDLEKQIDRLMGDFLGDMPARGRRPFPAIDFAEYENESVVVAELPGVKKEDVKISFHEGTLTITGERKSPVEEDQGTWLRKETLSGSFHKSVVIPHEVEGNAVTADLSNGLLRIVLPKAAQARPREIQVR